MAIQINAVHWRSTFPVEVLLIKPYGLLQSEALFIDGSSVSSSTVPATVFEKNPI